MRFRSLAVIGGVAIAACSESSIPTATAPMQGMGASASLVDGSGTYVIAFRGGLPADFANAVAALGGNVMWAHSGVGLAAVEGLSASAADALAARKDVAAVEADAYTDLPGAGEVESAGGVESASNPTLATRYNRQWNMRAIHAPEAWAAGKLGSSSTRVGILDTGIGYTHPDLVGRVDLTASRSFLSAAENARVTAAFPGANTIADLNYHGTHVAVTVASNGRVTAGVTSGVTLVGLKVCAPGNAANGWRGTCPFSAIVGGLLYAADIGLDVVNMSLGGGFYRRDASARGGKDFAPSFLAIINSVFNYVHRKGTAVVVSAGNSAWDLDHFGNVYASYCDTPHVICVSATGPTAQASVTGPWTNVDALAYYSNFGRSAITLAAPGGNNSSFVWAACSPFSLALPVCQTGVFIVGLQGTSMAAPHVTGVAALVAGEVGHDPDAIEARLTDTADDLGTPGTDPAYGKGRVNAAHAMGVSY